MESKKKMMLMMMLEIGDNRNKSTTIQTEFNYTHSLGQWVSKCELQEHEIEIENLIVTYVNH